MKTHPYYVVDVFTDKQYAGNQLAVFREAADLPEAEMQQIARETNFSETTFILSDTPRAGGFDVRIFTQTEEVPFAGHPTLGTAHILQHELLQGQAETVVLNLKAGQIPVTFGAEGYSWMRQMAPSFGQTHPAETLALVLGLAVSDFDEQYPVEEVSTGMPFFIVPLKTLAALKKAKVRKEDYFALIEHTEAKGILVFCPEPHMPQNDLSVRVFVDYHGVPEDPATGSGQGCLAGYLVRQRYGGQARINLRSEQGYEIGRPSLVLLKAEEKDGAIDVHVGGKSVVVARGTWG
jgi:trans-2,3-dihydro-3-hydroxyanthranilate isomerase